MKVEMLGIAELELLDAVSYYETEQQGLGERLLDEVERGQGQIAQYPHAWSKVSRRSRRYRLRRFPYGLIYQVVGEKALILAVMHLHRRPGYWRKREQ
jgi:mRNA-degrading endonuclease RelE of RelBE toxin-antitoxin system